MKLSLVENTYKVYSTVYDIIFGKVFEQGRKEVVENLKFNSGDRVLEVGVGTGLSLKYYPESVEVIGIDISNHMLEKAVQRVDANEWEHISLTKMNAENLTYEDEYFDKVVLMHVYSVTPNPDKLIKEAVRVCKKGGDIIILNHFSNEKLSLVEKLVKPFQDKIGFRTDFPLKENIYNRDLNVQKIVPANIFNISRIVHIKN